MVPNCERDDPTAVSGLHWQSDTSPKVPDLKRAQAGLKGPHSPCTNFVHWASIVKYNDICGIFVDIFYHIKDIFSISSQLRILFY